MIDSNAIKQWYSDQFLLFEKQLNNAEEAGNLTGGSELHKRRKDALTIFSNGSLPTIHSEEWRYTNPSSLYNANFQFPASPAQLFRDAISPFIFESEFITLVFVDGLFSNELSSLPQCNGISIKTLHSAFLENNPVAVKYFGSLIDGGKFSFAALNAAFLSDGLFIHLAANTVLTQPIHIVSVQSGSRNIFTAPRILLAAEAYSQATIVESYGAIGNTVYFTNAVTEIILQEGAGCEHIKIQEEGTSAFHTSVTEVSQEQNSKYTAYSVNTGGAIVRHDLNVHLNGEGAYVSLQGLSLLHGEQLTDNHTLIDHAVPHCESHELYKAVLNDESRGVFNGKVMVRKDAQKTNAFQANKTLLLSEGAVMNTKPQLEIFADDVKCSHGATIGRLDEDSFFYLLSRGIGKSSAKAILVTAFAHDIIRTISLESVREYLKRLIVATLGQNENFSNEQ